MRILLAALLAIVPLILPLGSQAKVVGILFDTSGSMINRDQLPSFGMQLLAGTIDGRAGQDRVLLMNFNAFMAVVKAEPGLLATTPANIARLRTKLPPTVARPIDILTDRAHQGVVDLARNLFVSQKDLGTPYGPIDVMLTALTEARRENEPAFLVIVSDGAYNEQGLPGPAALRAAYGDFKDRFPGGLRVEYLFILPQDPDDAAKLQRNIAGQGVRDALLDVFNDGARRADGSRSGAWTVSNGAQMWDALRDIIARISGSDLTAQRQFVQYDGNSVRIETPLSIGRVVAVSTANTAAAVPRWVSSTFDQKPTATRQVSARMDHADPNLDAKPMHGLVQHHWFANAVAAGRYEITFDRPVTDNVFLMFETRAVADLRIFDASGRELDRSGGGPVQLTVGEPYTFLSRIFDSPGTSPAPVPFSILPPSLTLTLRLAGPAGIGARSMDIDSGDNLGRFVWTPTASGEAVARTQAAIPGFLTPLSPSVPIRVVDLKTPLTVSPLQPTAGCVACTPAGLRSEFIPNGPDMELATFTVTANGQVDGAIRIETASLPPFVEIRDERGVPVDPSTPIPMAAAGTRRFSVWRLGTIAGTPLQGAPSELTIPISPAAPWTGASTAVSATLTLIVPDLTMRLVAVTQPATPGTLDGLLVPAAELRRGRFFAQLALDNAVVVPDPAAIGTTVHMSIDGLSGPLIGHTGQFSDPRVSGNLVLDVRPESSLLCLCFIGVENWFNGTDRRLATVAYRDHLRLQSAATEFALFLPMPLPQLGLSCLLNLLCLLLIVMVLRGIIAWFRTNRFPKSAVLEVQEGRGLPRFQRLRGNNYTWLRVWIALYVGDPHEKRTLQGLRLLALPDGAALDLSGPTPPPWTLERMGQSFAELKEQSRDLEAFRLIWGDRLEHLYTKGLVVRLKRNASDE